MERAARAADKPDREQARDLLRDIFGPMPVRTVEAAAAWLTPSAGAARRLAETIYEARAFERLPELAEVLERAGCPDAELLAHLRRAGGYVRGCWALDLIMDRE